MTDSSMDATSACSLPPFQHRIPDAAGAKPQIGTEEQHFPSPLASPVVEHEPSFADDPSVVKQEPSAGQERGDTWRWAHEVGVEGRGEELAKAGAAQVKAEHDAEVPFGPIFPLPMWDRERAFGAARGFTLPAGMAAKGPAPSQMKVANGRPNYKHLRRNQFVYRSHRQVPADEVAVCECEYVEGDPQSACGEERCLNAMLNSECTPGHCPCGERCLNQKFQRCQYANLDVVKTTGRGWGLFAKEDIEAGRFLVEYCGEVLSDRDVPQRLEKYAAEGEANAYILKLSGSEVIDATKKGSLGRFMNHSCSPNCITRKWNVLGEVRVGIYTAVDVLAGTELMYDYNFEWYGGEKVRCRCGAATCQGFLGSKSRAFQESAYLWDDEDPRYKVENVPTYDSGEEATVTLPMVVPRPQPLAGAQTAAVKLVEAKIEPTFGSAVLESPVPKKRRTALSAAHLPTGRRPNYTGTAVGNDVQNPPQKWPKLAAEPIFSRPMTRIGRKKQRVVPLGSGGASVVIGKRLQAPLSAHLFLTEDARADVAKKQVMASEMDMAWEATRKKMRADYAAVRSGDEHATRQVRDFVDIDLRRLGSIFECFVTVLSRAGS